LPRAAGAAQVIAVCAGLFRISGTILHNWRS
jgi:hypothetical protein